MSGYTFCQCLEGPAMWTTVHEPLVYCPQRRYNRHLIVIRTMIVHGWFLSFFSDSDIDTLPSITHSLLGVMASIMWWETEQPKRYRIE